MISDPYLTGSANQSVLGNVQLPRVRAIASFHVYMLSPFKRTDIALKKMIVVAARGCCCVVVLLVVGCCDLDHGQWPIPMADADRHSLSLSSYIYNMISIILSLRRVDLE